MFAGLRDAFAVPARSRPDRALSGLGEVRVCIMDIPILTEIIEREQRKMNFHEIDSCRTLWVMQFQWTDAGLDAQAGLRHSHRELHLLHFTSTVK